MSTCTARVSGQHKIPGGKAESECPACGPRLRRSRAGSAAGASVKMAPPSTAVVKDEGRPQDKFPGWDDGEFDRGPRPKTVGSVIEVVDNFGERGLYRLDRMESDPRFPSVHEGVWVNVHSSIETLKDSEIEQWKAYTYPETDAGDIEEAYRNAMHYLGRENSAISDEHEAMIKESGMAAHGAHFTSALALNPSTGERFPRAIMYGANADGSRGFSVATLRDPKTGEVVVVSTGDVESKRGQIALDYITKNKDRVMAWRERGFEAERLSQEVRSLLHEYKNETGIWL